jgi:hypothetical protein
MTRRDTIKSVHEPFGDAFYYGPERLSTRFEHDLQARESSGFSKSTYKTIFDQIDEANSEVRPFPSRPHTLSWCSSRNITPPIASHVPLTLSFLLHELLPVCQSCVSLLSHAYPCCVESSEHLFVIS